MNELIQSIVENAIGALPDQTLPCPDELSYYVLEKERKIYLESDVCADVMALCRLIMRWNMADKGTEREDRKPIWLYVMSYGGDLDYMWALIDMIKLSVTPVYTVNVGVAASAASLIFIAGHKRYMMPGSKVVIHEGSASVSGDAVKVMDASDSYKKELARMKNFIIDNTEIPKAHLSKKRHNDWELDSAYCLENHVCDCIVSTIDEVL